MTPNAYDLLIVGAGIVGAACAAEAAASGAFARIALVDSGPVGGGATAAGMGHIVVMDDSEPQLALTRYSQILWQQLSVELPPAVEYSPCGTIWIAAESKEMSEVVRKAQTYNSHGVPMEILSRVVLESVEPNLRPGLAGGLLVPQDSVIYAPAAARFLFDRARNRGVEFLPGITVVGIEDGLVTFADHSTLTAGVIVNAAGAGATALTPGLKIQKRKGHLVITDRYPGFVRHQLVELSYLKSAHSQASDSVAFNVQPRPTGQVLIGSSRQYAADDPGIDHPILAAMLARARSFMPGLANLSAIRAWTGFRAATPDHLPFIGPWPGSRRLYLATGHEGLGITTSLATAKLLIDQLLGRPPAIPFEPYLPGRIPAEPIHV